LKIIKDPTAIQERKVDWRSLGLKLSDLILDGFKW
jgi:hypothetical protein